MIVTARHKTDVEMATSRHSKQVELIAPRFLRIVDTFRGTKSR